MKRSGRPTPPVNLTKGQRRQLESMANARSLPHAQVIRARIVLMASEGFTNTDIASKVGPSKGMVRILRRRFLSQGTEGLLDKPRPWRPRTVRDEEVAEVIHKTLSARPKGATHWSCRTMAKETGLSKDTINRIRRATFPSFEDLVLKIAQFVKDYNSNCTLFARHATADSILAKVKSLCKAISETGH